MRPSSEERRREIAAAAFGIFAQKGYEATTLDMVAEALGYTKPALYYYFQNKEALFRSLILETLREARGRVAEIEARGGPARERLRAVIRLFLEDALSGRGYFSLAHLSEDYQALAAESPEGGEVRELSRAIPAAIIGILQDGVERGEFRREDPWVLGGLIIGMLSGVMTHLGMPALASVDRGRLGESLEEIIIRGISA